jgi:hypothetical protein
MPIWEIQKLEIDTLEAQRRNNGLPATTYCRFSLKTAAKEKGQSNFSVTADWKKGLGILT